MNLERAADSVDYFWGWNDYFEAGPYLNAVRYPRPSANVSDSPLTVRMVFADGLYLNIMPKKPNRPNGTLDIGQSPISAAVKEVAQLRHQFLSYFRDGIFLSVNRFLQRRCFLSLSGSRRQTISAER